MLQVIYLMRLMLLSKDAEAGTNINSLFGNITPKFYQILGLIKPMRHKLIFYSWQQVNISGATIEQCKLL
jgi:hypothetical protein